MGALSNVVLGLGLFEFLSAVQFWRDPNGKIGEHDGLMAFGMLDKLPVRVTWCSYLVTLGCVRILYWASARSGGKSFAIARLATVVAHVAEAAIWWACALENLSGGKLTAGELLREVIVGKRGGLAAILLVGVPLLAGGIALAPANAVEVNVADSKED